MSEVLSVVSKTIQQLLVQTFNQLREKQLLKLTPKFSQNEAMTIFNIYLHQLTPNYGTFHPCGLQQQDVTNILKIQKDNLSPKQLLSLDFQSVHTIMELPSNRQYSIRGRRSNMTNRSILKRRSSVTSHQLISGSTSERTNLQKKLTDRDKTNDHQQQQQHQKQIRQVNKLSKSTALRRDPMKNFTLLLNQHHHHYNISQLQSQQTIYLRQKVIFNSKQRQRQQNQINQRIRLQKQKIRSFNTKIGKKGNFTFEFNGQPLELNQLKDDQKIKYCEMKVDLDSNKFGRRYRTMYKHLEMLPNGVGKSLQQQQPQQLLPLPTSIPPRTRQPLNQTINLDFTLSEIPKFLSNKNQQKQYIGGKLKIEEYKKLYGRRFSRYDHPSYTIDITNVQEKNQNLLDDNLIMGRKHLTDSITVTKKGRNSSSVNKSYLATKLALPKLQGTYKMLDRYQQI